MNRKLIGAVLLSQIIEWYDFTLYGFFAGTFAKNFFPHESHILSLMAALSVFAISFLTRPIGSIFFGFLGDKYGRKNVYIYTYFLMGIATFAIGLIPDYAEIGMFAPLMLIILRLLQGFACGGIFTSAIVLLGEHAAPNKRYFFASFPWIGSLLGTLIGSGVASIVTMYAHHGHINIHAWRIAYFLGGLFSLIGILFRESIIETKEFIRYSLQSKSVNPIKTVFRKYKRLMTLLMLVNTYLAVASYFIVIYMPIYLSSFLSYQLHDALMMNTFSIFLLIILIPAFGYLGDKFGFKIIQVFSCITFIICAYPAFLLLVNGKFGLFAQLPLLVCVASAMAISPGMMFELTPTNFRLSICSIAYNLVIALCGGTAPLLATYLIHATGNLFAPFYYLYICALVSLCSALYLSNKKTIIEF